MKVRVATWDADSPLSRLTILTVDGNWIGFFHERVGTFSYVDLYGKHPRLHEFIRLLQEMRMTLDQARPAIENYEGPP